MTSSPTTPAAPARSTSSRSAATSGTASPKPLKIPVRRKSTGLFAQGLPLGEIVTLPNGETVEARAGDIRLTRGAQTIDVLSPERFAAEWESIVEQLTLTPADCARLEATTGLGSTQNATTLLAAVERLATIKIGEVKVDFTPGQLEELAHRAGKRGTTVAQELKTVVDRIKDEIFWRG